MLSEYPLFLCPILPGETPTLPPAPAKEFEFKLLALFLLRIIALATLVFLTNGPGESRQIALYQNVCSYQACPKSISLD